MISVRSCDDLEMQPGGFGMQRDDVFQLEEHPARCKPSPQALGSCLSLSERK